MAGNLDVVVELQNTLAELSAERALYEGIPEPMRELHEEYESLRVKIAGLQESGQVAQRERRAAEGEAADEQQKIDHYKAQIPRVTTQREYGALLTEIDGAQERKQVHEDSALQALERQDEAANQLEELTARFDEVDTSYQSMMQEWEESKPALLERIEKLEAEAEFLRDKLPKSSLRLFDNLFERHDGDPLARIDRIERPGKQATMWRCSVCNYSVRPQVVVQIQSEGELVLCDCGRQRLFYLGSDE